MFCCQILQKEELPQLSASHLDICNKTMNVQTNDDIGCIQLVYGLPGLYQGLYICPLVVCFVIIELVDSIYRDSAI